MHDVVETEEEGDGDGDGGDGGGGDDQDLIESQKETIAKLEGEISGGLI